MSPVPRASPGGHAALNTRIGTWRAKAGQGLGLEPPVPGEGTPGQSSHELLLGGRRLREPSPASQGARRLTWRKGRAGGAGTFQAVTPAPRTGGWVLSTPGALGTSAAGLCASPARSGSWSRVSAAEQRPASHFSRGTWSDLTGVCRVLGEAVCELKAVGQRLACRTLTRGGGFPVPRVSPGSLPFHPARGGS